MSLGYNGVDIGGPQPCVKNDEQKDDEKVERTNNMFSIDHNCHKVTSSRFKDSWQIEGLIQSVMKESFPFKRDVP